MTRMAHDLVHPPKARSGERIDGAARRVTGDYS
jgi:hypothetical protein